MKLSKEEKETMIALVITGHNLNIEEHMQGHNYTDKTTLDKVTSSEHSKAIREYVFRQKPEWKETAYTNVDYYIKQFVSDFKNMHDSFEALPVNYSNEVQEEITWEHVALFIILCILLADVLLTL